MNRAYKQTQKLHCHLSSTKSMSISTMKFGLKRGSKNIGKQKVNNYRIVNKSYQSLTMRSYFWSSN